MAFLQDVIVQCLEKYEVEQGLRFFSLISGIAKGYWFVKITVF